MDFNRPDETFDRKTQTSTTTVSSQHTGNIRQRKQGFPMLSHSDAEYSEPIPSTFRPFFVDDNRQLNPNYVSQDCAKQLIQFPPGSCNRK